MDMSTILGRLQDARPSDESLFVLLDGALFPAMQSIYEYETSPQACPIYYGTRHETSLEVSPCLYEPRSESKIWECSENWRDKVVIFTSRYSFFDVLRHVQSLISVSLSSGQLAYWRFYSPSWLASVMEVFEKEDLKNFTGPINQWAAYTGNGWKLYRPPVSEDPIHSRDEGWLHLSDAYIETWKNGKRKSFIRQIEERADEELGELSAESPLRDDISNLFDFAKGHGFQRASELERFIFLCLKYPDVMNSAEYRVIIEDIGRPPMERLDKLESALFGIREEESA
ncbi:hypothetical protein L861_22730 [Litchfieldella anticariensis FP35 = DSM 16096]|uniref:DUF4123 domain-containing protein n=2 Tax=Litchfieldella anticariensis TaxID=258591 RepID=S2KRK4_LITA3|nr:hypothetical protein L861_22730 [Halomonas anticariensis FP35 = DSM 16096]